MRPFFTVAIVALASACASPPPPSTEPLDVPVADTWSSTIDDAPADEFDTWWSNFASSALDSVVREALQANRELDAAVANVDAARATATIAGADRFPQINGSFNAARTKQIFVGLPIGSGVLSSLSNNFGLSANASWELDLWNRLGHRKQAAVADLQAAQADLAGARLSIAGAAARTWIALTELERQRALATRTLAAFEETLQIAEDRYARGLISSVDVHLTRASTENTAALLALRENQLQQTSRQLEVLLGRYPSGRLRGGDAFPEASPAIPAGLPAELVLRRPDLLAAERRAIASMARTGEARRNLLPRITLTGSTGTTSDQLGDLLDGDFGVWSIAGGLLQPIFQGGRLRAQVSANAAAEDAALAQWAQAVLDAFAEVETALAADELLAEREARLSDALEASRRAWDLSEDRYRQGIGNLLSVLEAQRRALTAESELIAVRSARLQTRVDLHLALGGGFDPSAGPTTDFLRVTTADSHATSESE